MGIAFIVLLVVLAAAAAYLSYYFKQKRRQGFGLMARQLGLQYSPSDPFDTLAEPFALFSKGDGRGVENVLWGVWQGLELRAFDYWYYEETRNSKGATSRTYYRFDCVIGQIDASCDRLTIDHENIFTRLADHLAMHDIEFESEEFNKRFNVKSPDKKFANDFIDSRMIQWLLQHGDGYSFEVVGDEILCFCKRLRPLELVPLVGTAKGFREAVPKVVYELYPKAGPPG